METTTEKKKLNEVKGIVEAKSTKYNGGLKLGENWYNATSVTKADLVKIEKGDFVTLVLGGEKGTSIWKVISDPDLKAKPEGNNMIKNNNFGSELTLSELIKLKDGLLDFYVKLILDIEKRYGKADENSRCVFIEMTKRLEDKVGRHLLAELKKSTDIVGLEVGEEEVI